MSQFESTEVLKYNPKDLDLFRKDIISFGLEVQKFSRKGSPSARTLVLSTDPLELFWVGKGGKRNQINLNCVMAVRTGFLPSEGADVQADHFPSEVFRKNGTPGNANLYVSLYLDGDEAHGRTTFDVQTDTPSEAKKLHAVLMDLCPNIVAASQVLVDFPSR
jgi:hypothetical protein